MKGASYFSTGTFYFHDLHIKQTQRQLRITAGEGTGTTTTTKPFEDVHTQYRGKKDTSHNCHLATPQAYGPLCP